ERPRARAFAGTGGGSHGARADGPAVGGATTCSTAEGASPIEATEKNSHTELDGDRRRCAVHGGDLLPQARCERQGATGGTSGAHCRRQGGLRRFGNHARVWCSARALWSPGFK